MRLTSKVSTTERQSSNKKSPSSFGWGFFMIGIFFLYTCNDSPKEVLQTLEDGTVIRRHFEVNGEKEGPMTDYYHDGTLKGERIFVKDVQEGRATWYYPNGVKQEVQMYEGGVLQGPDTLWLDDGSLQRVIHYQDGKKHGPMRTWKDGEVILEVIFAEDSVVTVTKSLAQDTIPSKAED